MIPTYFPLWLKQQRIILLQCRRPGFDSGVKRIPWRREWETTSVFLPGELHRQKILAGYSPRGGKQWDTTHQLTLSLLFSLTPTSKNTRL